MIIEQIKQEQARGLIERARVKLVLEHPFFASLLLEAKIIITEDIPTAMVDSKETFYINPEFASSLSEEELKTVIAHEVLHLALRHFARWGNRDIDRWSIATDLAINDYLRNSGFQMPSLALLPELFKFRSKLSAEEYYKLLIKKRRIKIQRGFDLHLYSDCDGVTSDESEGVLGDPEADSYYDKKWLNAILKASTLARFQGDVPGIFKGIIDELYNPKLNWKQVLRHFISSTIVVGGPDWNKPDRRFLSSGIMLPTRRDRRIELVIAIDVSGSIGDREVIMFFSEVNGLLQQCNNYSIVLIQCDAVIQDVQEITFPNKLKTEKITIKGRGGTDFRPVFEYMQAQRLRRPLIYFTDLHGYFPTDRPSFPVLWVSVVDSKVAPFGKTVYLTGIN